MYGRTIGVVVVLVVFAAMIGCDTSENSPPVAFAGNDTIVAPESLIVLQGTGFDDDGEISLYEWDFGATGSYVAAPGGYVASAAPAQIDTNFVCVLRVTDNDGLSAVDSMRVRVAIAPVAFAGNDTIAAPRTPVVLQGSGLDSDGSITQLEWIYGPVDSPTVVPAATATDTAPDRYYCPNGCDTTLIYVLKVTDNDGATATDTLHVLVSWLIAPNGGQVYHVGDTVHVDLMPISSQVAIRLIIDHAGDYLNPSISEFRENVFPLNVSRVSFVVPDSGNDSYYGTVSTVSDSCKIRVLEYMQPQTYFESVRYFAIRPR
jgi:hypothetical protein